MAKHEGEGVPPTSLQTVSVVDAAEELVRERVLSGELKPGERVREAPLAATLGISRHTLRAALSRLGAVGLLRYRENRGWSVPVFEREEYEDILMLRQALEAAAYRVILGERILPGDAVEQALADLVSLDDGASWSERIAADAALHQSLVDLAGSARLSAAFETMLLEFRLCRTQSFDWLEQLGLQAWKQLHVDLVQAFRDSDADAVAENSSHHVSNPWSSPRTAGTASAGG